METELGKEYTELAPAWKETLPTELLYSMPAVTFADMQCHVGHSPGRGKSIPSSSSYVHVSKLLHDL
jgi:hypothetical protein